MNTNMFPVSIVACLITIAWCLVLLRRLRDKRIRLLVGFLGLMCVCQAMRLLREAGIWVKPEVHMIVDVIDFAVTVLCFVSLFVLRLHHADHRTTKVMLRVSEASTNRVPAGAARQAAANL